MAPNSGSVDPSRFPDEAFELYSIPAFENGRPDLSFGREIGSSKQAVQPNDVLLSKIVPHIRRTWVVGEQRGRRQIASGEWIVFRSTRAHPNYLKYLLVEDLFHTKFMNTVAGVGGSLLRARPAQVADIEVHLPSFCEQRRIAEWLEQADRLKHSRRYALELTDTFLPAAFLEFFGDPAENPRVFDRVQVEDLFADSRGGVKCGPFGSALKKHEYVATGIPVWTMNNVGANDFVENGCLFITPQKFEELSAYDAQNGDILISRAGTVGRMAIVRTTHPRSIIHTNIIRLSLDDAKILPTYFVSLMTWFAPRIARLKRGQEGAYTFMSTGSLGELQIPLPPLPLQRKFAALVERVDRLRAVQREALRQAEHLFASLLDRAFSS
jgi:type I restriction enzyme S subunit